jgi:membrane protein
MTNKLVDASMLVKVTAGAVGGNALILARPAEKIKIVEILELAHRVRPTSDHPAWKTLANLKQAERAAADDTTLADLNQVFRND